LFADLERVRAHFGDPALGERRSRTGRERPVGRRAVRVLDRNRDRSVRIHELELAQRARDLPRLRRVVDAGGGMMRLERRTGHQTPEHDDTPQSLFYHLCLRKVVIGTSAITLPSEKGGGHSTPLARRRLARSCTQICPCATSSSAATAG